MSLDRWLIERANTCTEAILGLLVDSEPKRTGGYLVIRIGKKESPGEDFELAGKLIGEVSPEKNSQYEFHATEKAARLARYPDHVSSWQSRDEKNDKWGGAIRARHSDIIFSFSGLPWEADEALVLMLAVRVNVATTLQAAEIAQISGNSFYLTKALGAFPELRPAEGY